MTSFIEPILCVMSIVFAVLSLKLRDTIHAILALLCFTISIALLYFIMGAHYVAIFELSIYSGAMTTLFLIAVYMLRR